MGLTKIKYPITISKNTKLKIRNLDRFKETLLKNSSIRYSEESDGTFCIDYGPYFVSAMGRYCDSIDYPTRDQVIYNPYDEFKLSGAYNWSWCIEFVDILSNKTPKGNTI